MVSLTKMLRPGAGDLIRAIDPEGLTPRQLRLRVREAIRQAPPGPLLYSHHTVKHSRHFVAADGTHTNLVENFWKNAKNRFRSMAGVHETMLPSYLDEFLWRQFYGFNGSLEAMYHLIIQIADWYRVNV